MTVHGDERPTGVDPASSAFDDVPAPGSSDAYDPSTTDPASTSNDGSYGSGRHDTGTVTSDDSSTTDAAEQGVGEVASSAKGAAGDLTQSAKEQAGEVAGEVKKQARDLADEAKSQLNSQVGTQRDQAVSSLRSLGDELSSMADRSEDSGLGRELARQASGRAHDIAGFLDGKEPGDLLDEVRDFARRKPGTFLIGAALAGVVVGRLTRGVVASHQDDSSGASSAADAPQFSSGAVNGPYDGDTSYPSGASYTGAGNGSATPDEPRHAAESTLVDDAHPVGSYTGGADSSRQDLR